jgi:hypothetical protein
MDHCDASPALTALLSSPLHGVRTTLAYAHTARGTQERVGILFVCLFFLIVLGRRNTGVGSSGRALLGSVPGKCVVAAPS